jgi:tRNA dimethylallyltransferase
LNEPKKRPFTVIVIGLNAPREMVYERINRRVDKMVDSGLIEEAQQLFLHRHLNALNTVGYKELFDYFEGKYSLTEAIEKIKQNTRNFAKRQLTWFNKNKATYWIDALEDPLQKAVDYIDIQLQD